MTQPPQAEPGANYVWRVDTPKRTLTFDGYEIEVWDAAGRKRFLRTTLAELSSIAYRAPTRSMPGLLNLNLSRANSAGQIAFTPAESDGMDALVYALRQQGVRLSDKPPKPPTPAAVRVIAGAVALGVMGLGLYAVANLLGFLSDSDEKPGVAEAITKCETDVERLLKSPASAEFGEARYYGEYPKWNMSGAVDAQNSFGATLRAGWVCTAEVSEDGAWTVDARIIE